MKYKLTGTYIIIFNFIIVQFSLTAPGQSSRSKAIAYLSELETEVVKELNLARRKPKQYARFITEMKPYYVGKLIKRPGQPMILTNEGVQAAEEAIRFLNRVKPQPLFYPSKGMSLAAEFHVKTQGPTGQTGHRGTDGSLPADRVSRFGKWLHIVGENIAYGRVSARDIVIGLIIDDGVPGRGHRETIFNPQFRIIGVACGGHAKYGDMCVITFAGGFREKR